MTSSSSSKTASAPDSFFTATLAEADPEIAAAIKGELGRHFYVRQLRDVKVSAQVDLFSPGMLVQYAEICGWALAFSM